MRNSHTVSPHGNGRVSTGNGRVLVPMTVTPLTITQGDDDRELDSIMQDISDDDDLDQDELVQRIRDLQVIVRQMTTQNDELH